MKRVLWAIVAVFALEGAYAPSSLTAAQILQKAEDASGSLAPGAYVEVQEERGGGMVATDTTHVSGDDYVDYFQSGPFTRASGSYQGQHWWQDANGIVALSAHFRKKVDPNSLAWQHPDDPAYNVRVLGITAEAPQEYVVEANPPGGSDEYRYYNAKTFLLDRDVIWAKDRHKHVTEYSDYRTQFGQTLAFTTVYSDGLAQNDETDRIVSFERDAASAPLVIPSTRPLFDAGDTPVALPVHFTPHGIVVRVDVNGRGLDFLLDSGASSIVLDPGIAHELGIRAHGRSTETMGGDFDTSLAMVPDLSVGSLHMRNVAVTLAPMDEQYAGARIVGLLGFDFLAGGVPCIDFRAKTVTMYSRKSFLTQSAGLQPLPMMIDDGIPRVPASFEHVQGWFLIDTGSDATLVYNNYLKKLPRAFDADSQIAAIAGVGGAVDTRSYALQDFAFGPVLFRKATVVVPQESTFDLLDYDGIIGRDALSVYQIWLDYADRQAFLKSEAH